MKLRRLVVITSSASSTPRASTALVPLTSSPWWACSAPSILLLPALHKQCFHCPTLLQADASACSDFQVCLWIAVLGFLLVCILVFFSFLFVCFLWVCPFFDIYALFRHHFLCFLMPAISSLNISKTVVWFFFFLFVSYTCHQFVDFFLFLWIGPFIPLNSLWIIVDYWTFALNSVWTLEIRPHTLPWGFLALFAFHCRSF